MTDPAALRQVLAAATRNGIAEVQDANVEGASGVSAPIFGPNGEAVAAPKLGAQAGATSARDRMISIVCREAAVLTDYFRGVRTAVDAG